MVAKNNIPAGTQLILERAYGYVSLHNLSSDQVCECSQCRAEVPIDKAISSAKLGTTYCSKDCQQEAAPVRALEDSVLPHLPTIARAHDVDLHMLHLVLRASTLRVLESEGHTEEHRSTWKEAEEMVSHENKTNSKWLFSITAALQHLLQVLPAKSQQIWGGRADGMVTLACQINRNCHSKQPHSWEYIIHPR